MIIKQELMVRDSYQNMRINVASKYNMQSDLKNRKAGKTHQDFVLIVICDSMMTVDSVEANFHPYIKSRHSLLIIIRLKWSSLPGKDGFTPFDKSHSKIHRAISYIQSEEKACLPDNFLLDPKKSDGEDRY